jgi:hypothetical protein
VTGAPPGDTVSISTYYNTDSQMSGSGTVTLTAPQNQFGIEVPGSTRGNLTVTVVTYVPNSTCYSYFGQQSLSLNGSFRNDITLALAPVTPQVCDFGQAPAALSPTGTAPLVTWGDSETNIWVAGGNGVILRWDGKVLSHVPLPPELAGTPPTWRAISGSGPNLVWFAGNKGAVAHWDGSQLHAVSLVPSMDPNLTPAPSALPDWVGVSIADPQLNDVLFASSSNYIGRYNTTYTGVQTGALSMQYPAYPDPVVLGGTYMLVAADPSIALASVYCINNSLAGGECWFAGSTSMGGYIMQAYLSKTASNYIYSDYSMSSTAPPAPLTKMPLLGIWGNVMGTARTVLVVGAQGTALYSHNSMTNVGLGMPATGLPSFGLPCNGSPATCSPAMTTANLNAIAGTSVDDIWIAGDGGNLFHFDRPNQNPYVPKMLGMIPGDFKSIFSLGNRIFAAGSAQTVTSVATP